MCLQPAKLTEAFKYFIQGMGYSKFVMSDGDCVHCYQIPENISQTHKQLLSVLLNHDELNPLGTESLVVLQKPLRAGKILHKHESTSVNCDAANDPNLKISAKVFSQDSVALLSFPLSSFPQWLPLA